MGCFAGTCALTRTAIPSGHRVLLVVLHENRSLSVDFLAHWIAIDRDIAATYYRPARYRHFRYVGISPYDDYGGIVGAPDLEPGTVERGENRFLARVEAVEAFIERTIDSLPPEEIAAEVIVNALIARIELGGRSIFPAYRTDLEVELQRRLHRIAGQILDGFPSIDNTWED